MVALRADQICLLLEASRQTGALGSSFVDQDRAFPRSSLRCSPQATTSSCGIDRPSSMLLSASSVSSCLRCSSASHSLTACRTIQLLLRSIRSAISSIWATSSCGNLAVTTRSLAILNSPITNRAEPLTAQRQRQWSFSPIWADRRRWRGQPGICQVESLTMTGRSTSPEQARGDERLL